MSARTEDTTSASRTETPPVLFGQYARFNRGMRRPDGGTWAGLPSTPLLSVTASRKPYALIARSVLADQLLPDGAFALLASLASLHRGKRPLTLSAKELAVSQGVTLSTHYDRRHRLMVLGYLDEGGALKPEYRPSEVTKAASYCKVDLRAVHGLPPQAVRALAVLSDRCNGDKRSRARVPTLAACLRPERAGMASSVRSPGHCWLGVVEGPVAGSGTSTSTGRFRKTSQSIPANVRSL